MTGPAAHDPGPQGPIDLEVIADIACPWCYIAHRRLDRILRTSPEIAAVTTIRHRAFLLQPELPAEGVDGPAYFAAKFGGPERVRLMRERVIAAGASESIKFAFEKQLRASNTRLAHRVVAVIQEGGASATPTVDALFTGHFEEGLDVGDLDAMLARMEASAALEGTGLDGETIRARLAAGAGEATVTEDLRFSGTIGVTGVPFIIANRRVAISGAQPEEAFRELLAVANADLPAA